MNTELGTLYAMIDDIGIAMMTSRMANGHLRSRAMANQRRAGGADLWFVTRAETAKVQEIKHDPHVNLAYFNSSSKEWISVQGTAEISRDRGRVRELYAPDWKMWFGADGDPRHGTADDPRILLIGVTVHVAEFLEADKPKPVVLYELVKGWVTGSEPELGQMHTLHEPGRPPS